MPEVPPAAPVDDEDALAGDLAAVRSIFAGDASASFSRRPPVQDPVARIPDADDSALDLLAPRDEEQMPPPLVEPVDSGIDLGGAELGQELVSNASNASKASAIEIGNSEIDLGQAHVADPASSEGLSGIVVADSSLHLIDADALENLPRSESEPSAPSQPSSDVGLDLSGEDITVAKEDSGPLDGIEKNSPDSSESGRDLIAEEVESGLDLPMNQFKLASERFRQQGDDAVAGQLASEEEEVDLTEMSAADVVDSSSVDLGASASLPAGLSQPSDEPKAVESDRPHQTKSKSIHGMEESSPSEVNLGGKHDEPAQVEDFFNEASGLGGSGVPLEMTAAGESSGLLADGEPAVGMDDEQPAAEVEEAAEEEEAEERPAKEKKEKRPSLVGAGLGGAVLGGLLATRRAASASGFSTLNRPMDGAGRQPRSKALRRRIHPTHLLRSPCPSRIARRPCGAGISTGRRRKTSRRRMKRKLRKWRRAANTACANISLSKAPTENRLNRMILRFSPALKTWRRPPSRPIPPRPPTACSTWA